MTEDCTNESAKMEDLYLPDFQKNNPQCRFNINEGKFVIENAWSVRDISFSFDPEEVSLLKDINNIAFQPQFDAIFHTDLNEVEFLFAYLRPDREPAKSYIDRCFTFTLSGIMFECGFKEPSSRLFELAKRAKSLPTTYQNPVAIQLEAFGDAKKLDKLPESAKEYFDKRVPRSFFVKTEKPILNCDWELIARHLKFYMGYYDRRTPIINIRYKEEAKNIEKFSDRRFLSDTFPEGMAAHEIDDFMLQLIQVASESSPRFAFIYYYQVIEYAGFYFVDEKAKKEIRQFLSDPAMVMCPEDRVSELLTVLSDLQHSDEAKMCKVIDEYCDPRIVWQEIEHDRVFFSNPIKFEGGFELSSLVAAESTIDSWRTMWMPKTFHQLTKIRNSIVHGRERRQNTVIWPTAANTKLLERYLPVIRRVAEQITLTKV